MLSRPLAVHLVAALTLAAASNAGAQVTATRPPITDLQSPINTSLVRPIATVSFTPYSLYGSLNGVNVLAQLWAVTVSTMSRVDLLISNQSHIRLYTNPGQPLPGGAYNVSFAIPWVGGGGATASILADTAVVGTCQLTQQTSYASGAPVQHCASNIFDVPDGKLQVTLKLGNGQFDVTNITVNRFR